MSKNYTLYIADKKFLELIALFMVDIEEDTDFYDTIAINLLDSFSRDTMRIYQDLSIMRKIAILENFSHFKKCGFNQKDFLLEEIATDNISIKAAAIKAASYNPDFDNEYVKIFLDSKDSEIKKMAIQYFSRKLGLDFKSDLIDFLKDPDPSIREYALDELDFMWYEGIVKDIEFCLKDDNEIVRNIAQDIVNRQKMIGFDSE